jgi:hypothetical protein
MSDGYITFLFGRKHKDDTQKPPCIVVYPVSESIDTGDVQNGRKRHNGETYRDIFVSKTDFNVEIWGRDYQDVEYMRDKFLNVVKSNLFTFNIVQPITGTWFAEGSKNTKGERLDLSLTVKINITDQPQPIRPVVGETHNTIILNENGYCNEL